MKTNDGSPIFPNHLAKMRETSIRVRDLLKKFGDKTDYCRRFAWDDLIAEIRHRKFRFELLLTNQQGVVIYKEDYKEPVYLHKGLIDDALEKLRRIQVLDDLAEL
jgi:hypothetical protein